MRCRDDKTIVLDGFALGAIDRRVEVVAVPAAKVATSRRSTPGVGEDPIVTGWIAGTRATSSTLACRLRASARVRPQHGNRGPACRCSTWPPARSRKSTERGQPVARAEQAAFLRRYRCLISKVSLVPFPAACRRVSRPIVRRADRHRAWCGVPACSIERRAAAPGPRRAA